MWSWGAKGMTGVRGYRLWLKMEVRLMVGSNWIPKILNLNEAREKF